MRWRVEILGVTEITRLLREVLGKLSIDIIEDQNIYFLVSQEFEALESAAEVYALASRVQSIAEETATLYPELQIRFNVGCVMEKVEGGIQRKHGFASMTGSLRLGGSSSFVATHAVVSEEVRLRLDKEQRERDYQLLCRKAIIHVASAFHYERALQVQRLLRGELNAMNMRHIHDLIQADMGAAICELTSKAQLKRFDRSIHHPEVLGMQALHIVTNNEPPPNPMSMGEARAYILSVAAKWLERKAGL